MTQTASCKIQGKVGNSTLPALCANKWRIKTVEESNELGTWYNLNVEKVDLVDSKALFDEAKSFRSSVMKGEAKAVSENQDEAPF